MAGTDTGLDRVSLEPKQYKRGKNRERSGYTVGLKGQKVVECREEY